MRLMLWLAVSLAMPLWQGPPSAAVSQAAESRSSKIWIGRYTEFEEFLRTAPILPRSESTPVGVLAPRHMFFTPGGLAKGAAVKKIPPGRRSGFFESYKSEIAAYKLDRLLQLDMVPPTVERRIDGDMSSVQLWVENTRMLKEVEDKKLHSPDADGWNRQWHRVQVFDNLVGNIDENKGNLLFDPLWNFIKIDHSRAFTDTMAQPFDLEKVVKQIDRPFFERIKALDRETVSREIGVLLTENGATTALFRRRDAIVKKFEDLAKKQGEGKVFVSWPTAR
jgi:hypothetical protein